jgi:hypothetical protein
MRSGVYSYVEKLIVRNRRVIDTERLRSWHGVGSRKD